MLPKSMHHSFDIDLAEVYGIVGAILIHHFQHWIRLNKKKKINHHEGRTWTYQTLEDIADHFPYLTKEDVRGALEYLCTGKGRRSKKDESDFEPVLVKGHFNKSVFDRTTWYAFSNESKFLNSNNVYEREISQMDGGDLLNGEGGSPTPIPDTKTYTDTKDCNVEGGEPPPVRASSEVIEKKTSDGRILQVETEQIYLEACKQKRDWTIVEVEEAIRILQDFNGPVNSLMGFIEGTIKKLRVKENFEKMEKAQWNPKKHQTRSKDYKPTSSGKDTPELILVPLSSIMNTECALTRGAKKDPESSS